ncbi:hypothetical protein [Shewanella salipaludis]|uniref:Uncharacterized protein n=1 Tax=Shewanella salipaludis TaxID=2723052 RepID=A0A972JJT4_9GAMM|nr:hypothetical protein [Shewanella salipaludis]NMH66458.1 hypothetical protein [Shewanella salipaludis]
MTMSKRKPTIKGLVDIRTLSGRGVSGQKVYQIYLKLGTLEMEKLRRQKERDNVLERMNTINHRLQSIDAEIDMLRRGIEALTATEVGADKVDAANNSAASGPKRGFKLRY